MSRDESGEWTVAKECVRRSQSELAVLVASRSFDVYTDGSAPRGNPGGPVGFAAVFVAKGKRPVNLSTALAGRDQEPKSSNNRAEIAGVALALLAIAGLLAGGATFTRIVIWCDSNYVIRCLAGDGKRKANLDLWSYLLPLWSELQQALPGRLELLWTRGHSGNRHNEEADVLAQAAALATVPGTERVAAQPDYLLKVVVRRYHLQTRDGRERSVAPPESVTPNGNLAEYLTLLAGLSDLLEALQRSQRRPHDFSLRVESASQLMIKQLGGEYRVRSAELLIPYANVQQRLQGWKTVELVWTRGSELRRSLKT